MTTISEISPAEAQQRIHEFQPIDVRAPHEYGGPLGHVAGAELAPLPELEARARSLPRGRPFLLVCRSGARSRKACEMLAAQAVGPAVNLAGGMIAWNRAGLPVQHVGPASLRELLDGALAWSAQVGGGGSEVVRAELRAGLRQRGLDADALTHATVAQALDLLEESFLETEPPSDLELSLAAFRRWLAVL